MACARAATRQMASEFYCTICADEHHDGAHPTFTLECNHSFHTSCLVHWFRCHHDTCPNCRSTQSITVRMTPRQRVQKILRMQTQMPIELRSHVTTYQRVMATSKTLRATLRAFKKDNNVVLRKHQHLIRSITKCRDKEEALFAKLARAVVPGVPLLLTEMEYDSESVEDDEDD